MPKHTGSKKFTTPQKDNHMQNFELALKDALNKMQGQEDGAPVTFEADVSPNPGGIKEYRVMIGR